MSIKVKAFTPTTKKADLERNWHLVNVNEKILGRVATTIAELLMGKTKTLFDPHMDNGDHVVVINATNVKVTGKKLLQKVYTRYSGYPGGLRKVTLEDQMAKDPRKVIINAVAGMLPKNKLRADRLSRLHVFAHETHSFSQHIKE